MKAAQEVVGIEVLEDLSGRSRCDEGFIHLKRLRARNRYADGTASREYRIDVVDRPIPDAVAVLIWRRGASGLEVLTRKTLRPAAHFRAGLPLPISDPRGYLFVDELVAGVLEPSDRGEEGLLQRAAEEVREEAGFWVSPTAISRLGGSFFLAPGILSEKIHPTVVDVTGLSPGAPSGDGSPLEEGATLRWWEAGALLDACRSGEVEDAKTEVCLRRYLETVPGQRRP